MFRELFVYQLDPLDLNSSLARRGLKDGGLARFQTYIYTGSIGYLHVWVSTYATTYLSSAARDVLRIGDDKSLTEGSFRLIRIGSRSCQARLPIFYFLLFISFADLDFYTSPHSFILFARYLEIG